MAEAAAGVGGEGRGGGGGGGGGRQGCSYWYPRAEAEASLCPYSAYGE